MTTGGAREWGHHLDRDLLQYCLLELVELNALQQILPQCLLQAAFIDLQTERVLDICNPRDCQNAENAASATPPVAQQNCVVLCGV